jgi:hypothetical protein
MTPIFTGQILPDGKLELDRAQDFTTHKRTLIGKKIELTLRQQKSKRSRNQRAYYFGVIVKMLADQTGYSKDEMNELLKLKFNNKVLILGGAGQGTTIGMSIENEKTDRVEEIYRDIREWAFEFFGLSIPEPNQVELPK